MVSHIEGGTEGGVFENGVLRVFGPERDEVTGEWRRLHKEELYHPYWTNVIWVVIKSRRM